MSKLSPSSGASARLHESGASKLQHAATFRKDFCYDFDISFEGGGFGQIDTQAYQEAIIDADITIEYSIKTRLALRMRLENSFSFCVFFEHKPVNFSCELQIIFNLDHFLRLYRFAFLAQCYFRTETTLDDFTDGHMTLKIAK